MGRPSTAEVPTGAPIRSEAQRSMDRMSGIRSSHWKRTPRTEDGKGGSTWGFETVCRGTIYRLTLTSTLKSLGGKHRVEEIFSVTTVESDGRETGLELNNMPWSSERRGANYLFQRLAEEIPVERIA